MAQRLQLTLNINSTMRYYSNMAHIQLQVQWVDRNNKATLMWINYRAICQVNPYNARIHYILPTFHSENYTAKLHRTSLNSFYVFMIHSTNFIKYCIVLFAYIIDEHSNRANWQVSNGIFVDKPVQEKLWLSHCIGLYIIPP